MSVISDIVAREILDSRGNPTIEVDVVLVHYLNTVQCILKALHGLRRVVHLEFLRHEGCSNLEIGAKSGQNIQDARDVVDKSNIDGLDLLEKRKPSISDNEGVCMTNTADQ